MAFDLHTLWWVLAILMMLIGVVGTVLPVLPGTALVFAGIVLAAWADDFSRVSGWVIAICAVLAGVALAVDYVAGALGAKRAGASSLALLGATVGTVVGIFTGLIGLLFMPLIGAAIGQYLAEPDALRAGKVGLATWLGMLLGAVAKLVLVFAMLGVFFAALWL